jgi:GNAT superfamily N-acetyltransferase
MTELVVTALDPFDDAEFDEFHAVYDAGHRFGREDLATNWERDELRAAMQEDARRRFRHGLCGRLDGRMVATGLVEGPLLDNLDLCEVQVTVLPEFRRRGLGSQMLAAVEQAARDRGRSTVLAIVDWPKDGHPEGVGESAVQFGARHGYTLALAEIQRRLPLPVDEVALDVLAGEAADRHDGYTLRSWVGPVPEELLQGWAEVTSSLLTEAPNGDIEREPETPDPARVREAEALAFAQKREIYATAALASDGTVVAYSNFGVNTEGSPRAYQWGTLVRPEHRGHRLGLAVKVANLRLLQSARPDLREVVTWNAEVNVHMIAVNEQMGFVIAERSGELQKRLT